MIQHYSTRNFGFHFINDDLLYAVYRDNIRVANFFPQEVSIRFVGGDTFTLDQLDELKPAMKHLASVSKVERLVEEYLADPNCNAQIWIADLVSTNEATKTEEKMFLTRLAERKATGK